MQSQARYWQASRFHFFEFQNFHRIGEKQRWQLLLGYQLHSAFFWCRAHFGEDLETTFACSIFRSESHCIDAKSSVIPLRLPRLSVWANSKPSDNSEITDQAKPPPFSSKIEWETLPRRNRSTTHIEGFAAAHPITTRVWPWWSGHVTGWRLGQPQRPLPSVEDPAQHEDQNRDRDIADALAVGDPSYAWIARHPGACQPLRDYLTVNPNGRLSYLVNQALLARKEREHEGRVTRIVSHGPFRMTDSSQLSGTSEWNACNAVIERFRAKVPRLCGLKTPFKPTLLSYTGELLPSRCRCRPSVFGLDKQVCELAVSYQCVYDVGSKASYEVCRIL